MPVGLLFTWNAVDRPHESEELARDDPVKIAIFDFLVVLVLLDVKFGEVVPALLNRKLETLKTVLYLALVETVALACISIGSELTKVGLEDIHNFIRVLLKTH